MITVCVYQAGIARALYNLGNIYHAHGKQLSRASASHEPGKFSPEVLDLLQKAVNCYKLVFTRYFGYMYFVLLYCYTGVLTLLVWPH